MGMTWRKNIVLLALFIGCLISVVSGGAFHFVLLMEGRLTQAAVFAGFAGFCVWTALGLITPLYYDPLRRGIGDRLGMVYLMLAAPIGYASFALFWCWKWIEGLATLGGVVTYGGEWRGAVTVGLFAVALAESLAVAGFAVLVASRIHAGSDGDAVVAKCLKRMRLPFLYNMCIFSLVVCSIIVVAIDHAQIREVGLDGLYVLVALYLPTEAVLMAVVGPAIAGFGSEE